MAKSKRSAEKEAFWRLALDECRGSGLSVRAFCRREGLSEASFYSWRKTVRKRDAAELDAAGDRATLVPVAVVDPVGAGPHTERPSPPLEVLTPSGFTFRFHQDLQPHQLHALLGAIAHCQGTAPC